jgi:hypothetical protein
MMPAAALPAATPAQSTQPSAPIPNTAIAQGDPSSTNIPNTAIAQGGPSGTNIPNTARAQRGPSSTNIPNTAIAQCGPSGTDLRSSPDPQEQLSPLPPQKQQPIHLTRFLAGSLAVSRAFSLGDAERAALPVPSAASITRKDVHNGAVRVAEGDLRDVADTYANSLTQLGGPGEVKPADIALQVVHALSSETYIHLLRATLLVLSPTPVPLQDRVAFGDWLQGVFKVRLPGVYKILSAAGPRV